MHLSLRDVNQRVCGKTPVGILNLKPNTGACAVQVDNPNTTFQQTIQQCCKGAQVIYADDQSQAVPIQYACKAYCDYPLALGDPYPPKATPEFFGCFTNAGFPNQTGFCQDGRTANDTGAASLSLTRQPQLTSALVTIASVLLVLPLATFAIGM
ncbi:hypothetical protein OC835_006133 [Tilletia horrida]|nr:hypothetical protein OC835_006133 [Tilletia horrida]KAK0558548.1 hypothetical protein OC844_005056 [Tilletia horrida]